jgi:hypothetical protein
MSPAAHGVVERREIRFLHLGGLHHRYTRAA